MNRRLFARIGVGTASLALILALAACDGGTPSSPDPTPVLVVERPAFEGTPLPGTPADAKASGFTDCRDLGGHFGFECQKSGASALGFPVLTASVTLDWPLDYPADAERTPETSTYRSISYFFEEGKGSKPGMGCVSQTPDPFECAIDPDEPLHQITRRLLAEGWKARSHRLRTHFFKAGVPMVISVSDTPQDQHVGGSYRKLMDLTVTAETLDEVETYLKEIAGREAVQASASQSNAAFIDSMKTP